MASIVSEAYTSIPAPDLATSLLLRVTKGQSNALYISRSNTFPRSERLYLDPRSIDIFRRQNRRIRLTKPQEIARQKCRCFGGPFPLVHFSGKY